MDLGTFLYFVVVLPNAARSRHGAGAATPARSASIASPGALRGEDEVQGAAQSGWAPGAGGAGAQIPAICRSILPKMRGGNVFFTNFSSFLLSKFELYFSENREKNLYLSVLFSRSQPLRPAAGTSPPPPLFKFNKRGDVIAALV